MKKKKYPKDFHNWADFINPTQEQGLLDYCDTLPFKPYMYHGYAAKREDVLFGVSYNKSTKTFSLGAPIPAFFDPLINQVVEKANMSPEEIVEMSIQRYPEGAAIGWHRDTPYHRVFAVSLLSDCMFRLKPYSRSDDQRKHIFKILTQ